MMADLEEAWSLVEDVEVSGGFKKLCPRLLDAVALKDCWSVVQ
jgi:hypothetical protein